MTSSPAATRKRFPLRLEVVRTDRLTPHMQRVVLGGAGFDDFLERWNGRTDSYVKVLFLHDGVVYPEPLDMDKVREALPVGSRPYVRTYTVRWVDRRAHTLAIDFVVHGDEGVAGPWSLGVRPGATVHLLGPGGAYSPSPDVRWHLLAGDEAALPAIQAALEAMPADATARLPRGGRPRGRTDAQAFVHGEAGLVKALRSYLLNVCHVEREMLSISGYWRRGNNEEGFRAWKSEQPRT